VTVLAGGTAGSQVLLLIAAPVLTRLYTPQEFGVLAVFSGILAVFIVVANLRYELAIPLPEDDKESVNIVVLCLCILFAVAATCSVSVWLFAGSLANLIGEGELARYLWLLPVGVLLGGAFNIFHYWAIRSKNFPLIAKSKLKQSLSMIFIQLTGYKLNALGLMLGQTASQGVGSLVLARHALKHPDARSWSLRGICAVGKKYSQFPLYSTWGALSNTAGSQMPALMFAALFSGSAAGLYILAHRVLAMPMALVGTAIGSVFFSGAADAHRTGGLKEMVKDLHQKLAHIAMPVMMVLVIIGPELFSLVFGHQWLGAGEMARWMAPWVYIVFITSPLSTLFSVLGKEKIGMWFQVALALSRFFAIIAGYTYGGLLETVMVFSGVSVAFWISFLIWIFKITGNSPRDVVASTLGAMLISLVCISPMLIAEFYGHSSAVFYTALALTATFIAVRYLFMFRRAYK